MQSPSAIRITDIQNQNWNSTMESRCNPIDRTQILSSRSGREYVHSLSSVHKILKSVENPWVTNQQNALCCWQYVLWFFPQAQLIPGKATNQGNVNIGCSEVKLRSYSLCYWFDIYIVFLLDLQFSTFLALLNILIFSL